MRCVYIASPLSHDTQLGVEIHKAYARAACSHATSLGESVYCPHVTLTQWLDDKVPEQRALGMAAGNAMLARMDAIIFYIDMGWSRGMKAELASARKLGLTIETRRLPDIRALWIAHDRCNDEMPGE